MGRGIEEYIKLHNSPEVWPSTPLNSPNRGTYKGTQCSKSPTITSIFSNSLSIFSLSPFDISYLRLQTIDNSFIMTPTEMIHCGPPLVLPPSATPPHSPILSSVVALDDDQAKEMASAIAAMKIPPTTPYYHCCSCQSPSGITTSTQVEFVRLAKQFLDVIKSHSTMQGPPPPRVAAADVPPARASKLEFKTVNEVSVVPWSDVTAANSICAAGMPRHTSTNLWNQ
jgi:hypothetical protein